MPVVLTILPLLPPRGLFAFYPLPPLMQSPTDTDSWLAAAEALCAVTADHQFVAALSHDARFETRGRGAPVRGVALESSGGGNVQARIGVILAAAVIQRNAPLDSMLADLRPDLERSWQHETGRREPLRLELHLLDAAA